MPHRGPCAGLWDWFPWLMRARSCGLDTREILKFVYVCVCVCVCVCRLKFTFLHNFHTSESKLISFFEVESLSSFSMLPLHFHSHYLSPYLLLLLFFFFFFLQILFVDLAALGFSCGTWDLRCIMWDLSLWHTGFSSCGIWAPELTGSVVAAVGGRSTACRILVHWPRIEPTSPALQGRFLTTEPPGESLLLFNGPKLWRFCCLSILLLSLTFLLHS